MDTPYPMGCVSHTHAHTHGPSHLPHLWLLLGHCRGRGWGSCLNSCLLLLLCLLQLLRLRERESTGFAGDILPGGRSNAFIPPPHTDRHTHTHTHAHTPQYLWDGEVAELPVSTSVVDAAQALSGELLKMLAAARATNSGPGDVPKEPSVHGSNVQ